MKEKIINRLEEHLEYAQKEAAFKDYLGVFLFGSQNYGLEDADSDVDCRIVYFADADSPIASPTNLVTKNMELIELIDARHFLLNLSEGVLPILESVLTDYCIINPKYAPYWTELIRYKEAIMCKSKDKILSYAEHYAQIQLQRFLRNEGAKKSGTFYTIKPAMHMLRAEEIVKRVRSGDITSQLLKVKDVKRIWDLKYGETTYAMVEKTIMDSYKNILCITQNNLLIKQRPEEEFWDETIYPIVSKILEEFNNG